MKVKQIYPGIYLYIFPNQFDLCSTFFRLQEFYESPIKKIRGKYFTYEQAIDAYAYLDLERKETPEFTYFEDWNGFNVPGDVVLNFNFLFQDITKKEEKILNKIDYSKAEDFYILGVVKGDEETIQHEIAHAFYYLNKEYKKEMNNLLKQMPKRMRKRIEKELLSIGYCKQVLKDEIQAYLSTEIREGMISIIDYTMYWHYLQKFKKTFKKYYKEIKNG
jgi:hypothetical protein